MSRALLAEWTKLRTVRSTTWWVLAVIGLAVALSALTSAAVEASGCAPPGSGCEDTTVLSLSGVYLAQVAVVSFAVLAVTTEYETGLIRSTLAANPHRAVVFLAKAAVLTGTVLVAGLLGLLAAFLAGRAILPGNGFTAAHGYPSPSLADEPTLRAVLGTDLYLGLLALLSLGAATALRHTAATITVVLAMLYVPPIITRTVPFSPHLIEMIEKYSPMTAGLAVQATAGRPDHAPIGPWAGLAVFAAYACVALLLGYWLLRTRDA